MSVKKDKPIVCNNCGENSGYTEESIQFMVIPRNGLKCKNCGKVVIQSDTIDMQRSSSSSTGESPWSWML